MIVKELFAKLGLEVDEGAFEAGEAAIHALKHGLVAVGAAVGAASVAISAMVGQTATAAHEIERASQRTGVGVEKFQELNYAAGLAGVSMEELAHGLNFLARQGVRDVDGTLRRLADRFKAMPDDGQKAALAIRYFGRAGAGLIPLLNKGSAALAQAGVEARELGVILDEETIKQGAALKVTTEKFTFALKGLAYTIAGPLLEGARETAEAMVAWVRANREWIATKIHVAIGAVKSAASVLYKLLKPLLWVFGKLVKSTWFLWAAGLALAGVLLFQLGTAVFAAVGAVGALIASLGALTLAEIAAAAVPALIGLAIVAAVGAALLAFEDLYHFITGGESVFGDLWEAVKKVAPKIWQGLVDAIKTAIGYWKDLITGFWGWVVDGLASLGSKILEGLKAGVKAALGFLPGGDFLAGKMFGTGAAGPDSSVEHSVSKSTNVVAPQMSVQMSVQAAPGQNPEDVAGAVQSKLDDYFDTKMRETAAAVQ